MEVSGSVIFFFLNTEGLIFTGTILTFFKLMEVQDEGIRV